MRETSATNTSQQRRCLPTSGNSRTEEPTARGAWSSASAGTKQASCWEALSLWGGGPTPWPSLSGRGWPVDHLLFSWCSSFFFTLSPSHADCFSTWLEFILPDDFGRRRVCEAWWHHWKADIRGGETAQWLVFILLQCHLEPKHTYKKNTLHKRIVNTNTQTRLYTFCLSAISILAEQKLEVDIYWI